MSNISYAVWQTWGNLFSNNHAFEKTFKIALARQILLPERNGFFARYTPQVTFSKTSEACYRSHFKKILYCMVPPDGLENIESFDPASIFEQILNQTPLLNVEQICERIQEVRPIQTSTFILIIRFYCLMMGEPIVTVPRGVKFPKDLEKLKEKMRKKDIVLIEVVSKLDTFIENKVLKMDIDLKINSPIIRGAIFYLLILSTGMRINETKFLSVEDLEILSREGTLKSEIHLKKKSNRFNYIKIQPGSEQRIKWAIELMKGGGEKLLKFSETSPTSFRSFDSFVKAGGAAGCKSNYLRHYLVSSNISKGINVRRVAQFMNHSSLNSTKHYIGHFNAGPLI